MVYHKYRGCDIDGIPADVYNENTASDTFFVRMNSKPRRLTGLTASLLVCESIGYPIFEGNPSDLFISDLDVVYDRSDILLENFR